MRRLVRMLGESDANFQHRKAIFEAGGGPAESMSLRDYFAAAALKGILARPVSEMEGYGVGQTRLIAEAAFQHADAMLAARAKTT